MHLVVGGSGQLGTALMRQLLASGTPVRAFVRPTLRCLPPRLSRVMQVATWPFAPAASSTMGMNYLAGSIETPWDGNELTCKLGVGPLRTVREFLEEKSSLPDRASTA